MSKDPSESTDPIETFAQAVKAYETHINRSNVGAIRNQFEQPHDNELEKAKRQSYSAIVRMCEYLNSWKGAADSEFLRQEKANLQLILERIKHDARLKPFAHLAHYAQGFVYRGLGLHKEAFDAFDKSVQSDPSFFRADAQRAAQKIYLDELLEAKDLNQKVLAKTPPDTPAFGNGKWTAGRIEFFLGNDQAAIELLEESIRVHGELWYTFAYQCSAYAYVGQYEQAKQLLNVLADKFDIRTLQDVENREKLNPTAGSKSVEAGRQRLHDGLIKAGLPVS